jgi:hypothetical protein
MSKKYKSLIRFIHKGVEVHGNVDFDENNVPFNALDFDLLTRSGKIIPLDDDQEELVTKQEVVVEQKEVMVEQKEVVEQEKPLDNNVNVEKDDEFDDVLNELKDNSTVEVPSNKNEASKKRGRKPSNN